MYVHMFTKECARVYVYVGTGITHFSHTILTTSETTTNNQQFSGVVEGRFQLHPASVHCNFCSHEAASHRNFSQVFNLVISGWPCDRTPKEGGVEGDAPVPSVPAGLPWVGISFSATGHTSKGHDFQIYRDAPFSPSHPITRSVGSCSPGLPSSSGLSWSSAPSNAWPWTTRGWWATRHAARHATRRPTGLATRHATSRWPRHATARGHGAAGGAGNARISRIAAATGHATAARQGAIRWGPKLRTWNCKEFCTSSMKIFSFGLQGDSFRHHFQTWGLSLLPTTLHSLSQLLPILNQPCRNSGLSQLCQVLIPKLVEVCWVWSCLPHLLVSSSPPAWLVGCPVRLACPAFPQGCLGYRLGCQGTRQGCPSCQGCRQHLDP